MSIFQLNVRELPDEHYTHSLYHETVVSEQQFREDLSKSINAVTASVIVSNESFVGTIEWMQHAVDYMIKHMKYSYHQPTVVTIAGSAIIKDSPSENKSLIQFAQPITMASIIAHNQGIQNSAEQALINFDFSKFGKKL